MMTIVTFTTDFGVADGYVGAMKGVILSLASQVTLVDISHAVPPQGVHHGARLLATAAPFFPEGTIHVAVVDPGVGSNRRGIALQTLRATFVGPDNGLFTAFLRDRIACVSLTNPATFRHPVSATFHGRDIFASVAAHLANGMPLADLGPPVCDPVCLPMPSTQPLPNGRLRGEVVYVDRFGNLVTNVRPIAREGKNLERIRIAIGDLVLDLCRTYADVRPGEPLAVVGGDGFLEIAVRDGSAAVCLDLGVGTMIEVMGFKGLSSAESLKASGADG